MDHNSKGKPFLIVAGAILLLFGLSFVPWGELTGNALKDFNLLSDLFPGSIKVTAEETLDPELANALAEADDDTNSQVVEVNTDTVGQYKKTVTSDGNETVSMHQVAEPKEIVNNVGADGTILIEDYTIAGNGLVNLRRALGQAASRPVRIAVIGDSYIEGDIFTMNLREALQSKYGGAGVGYMPASSELTGFRTTVKQSCSGWTKHEIRDKSIRSDMKTLQGEYFTSNGAGKSSYSGTSAFSNLANWNKTMVLAVAQNDGTVTLTTDAGTETFQVPGDNTVHALTVSGPTAKASLSASTGVEIAGVYLNNATGVSVDNMSLRGNSGQTHRKLNVERAAQMRPYADYDLIIVEYGINALSSQQSNYSGYQKLMMQTISRLRECYPNADILMMGIGDRGQKIGGDIQSVPTAANMVSAQRDAARQTGILFWDTREAMGGKNAVVDWRKNGYINADYIHLNAKGGKRLSEIFLKSLYSAL